MSWVGGKKALREEVVKRFPLFYERYVEVFGGGGWVLFHKAPGNDMMFVDCGFIAQNIYLYCASAGLGTVVRGSFDADELARVLKLNERQKAVLTQTVGYPAQ